MTRKLVYQEIPPPIKSNAEMLELKEFYQVRSILASVEEIERRVKERKEIILYVCGGVHIYVCKYRGGQKSGVFHCCSLLY